MAFLDVGNVDNYMKNRFEGKRVVFIEDDNDPVNADGKRGHLKTIGTINVKRNKYDLYIKRMLDIALSLGGIVVLGPLLIGVSAAIYIDDPGPVIFSQKRIGLNKKYFNLHKFRTMKMSTPRDTPIHMLDNPKQYITRVGGVIRRFSLDEIVQMFDILKGEMSVIGPRPALWNQDVLVAERDTYRILERETSLIRWHLF